MKDVRGRENPHQGDIRTLFQGAPRTIQLYVLVTIVQAGVVAGVDGGGSVIFAFALAVLFAYLLLRGYRVVWWLSVATLSISVVLYAVAGGAWWLAIVAVGQLVLLITPASRLYFEPAKSVS